MSSTSWAFRAAAIADGSATDARAREGGGDAAIARQINCGQIEELVVQAQEELKLVGKMKEWKAWEPLATPVPPNQWERA